MEADGFVKQTSLEAIEVCFDSFSEKVFLASGGVRKSGGDADGRAIFV